MVNCESFKKIIAWVLIASMINPALIAPAFARDSDIYLTSPAGTSTAEPNVLFILGTNDRMNIAEAWREYDPVTYDSHAEYLWNDLAIINTTEVVAENINLISTAAPPVNPFSAWGTWSGALNTDRRALWQATLAYAQGTQAGDPGPRSVYRNYWLGSWHYWAPTGTPTTHPLLWSVSFNRFLGFVQTVPGIRGGVTFPPASTPNYTGSNDFRSQNLCASSLTELEPSTIFAPTGRAQNAGFMLNQQWVRWEPFLGLQAVNNPAVNYPGNNTGSNGATVNTSSAPSVTTFYRGYVDGVSGAPTNTATSEPTNVYRNSWSDNIGGQGFPIRRQTGPTLATLQTVTSPTNVPDGLRSYAGWTDPKADLGGFVFYSWTAYPQPNYYPQSVLAAVRGVYSYGLGAAGVAQVPAGSLAYEQFSAWLGNRDGAPAFGRATGMPGYYDATVASCNPNSGPTVGQKCIQFSSGASVYAIQQSCTPVGAVRRETDASGTVRFTQAAGACNPTGAATCSVNGVNQPMAQCTGAPANLTPPVCNLLADNNFFTTYVNANCGYGGGTVVNVGTCQWSGRQSVYIEGQGTYYYGGTCGESGYDSTQPNSSCAIGGGGLAPGAYNASKTLNGVAQPNVIGAYPSPAPASGTTTLGCYNTVAAGSYRYGGSCSGGQVFQMPAFNNSQVPGSLPVSPAPNPTVPGPAPARIQIGVAGNPVGSRAAVCAAPSGGSSINIRNAGSQTYNQSCNNNYSNVNSCVGWYGSACQPNSTPSANCQTPVRNTIAAGALGQWYQAYQLSGQAATGMVHECLADSPSLNPGGNSYPTSFMRTFTQGANQSVTVNASTNLTEAYVASTAPAPQRYPVDAAKNIDVYSNNYMNFLYGAKACRDSSGNLITAGPLSTPPAGATCSPIARKTRLQVAKDALSGLVTATDGVRLGLMVYNKTDTTTANEGGNIVYAVRRMGANAADLPAYNNRASLASAIQSVVASSRTPLTETMYEAYRYFSGRTPTFGTLATAAQVGGAVSAGREATVGANVDDPSVYGNVFLTNSGGTYNSPMLNNPNVAGPANCQKNYIVMLTNGQPEEDASANAAIKTMAYAAATGATVAPRTDFDTAGATPNSAGAPDYRQVPTVIGGNPYGPTDAAGTGADGGYVWLDELTYFMSSADISPGAANFQSEYSNCGSPSGTHVCDTPTTTDLVTGRQSVITYTIGFAGVSAPVVQNAAAVSGGIYYIAQNAQQLQAALTAAFVAIASYDATTAAVTVPISSLNRGVSSSDIYLAFFAPSSASVWPGTVKKFQLSTLESDCGVGAAPCLIGQTLVNGVYNIETHDPITGQGVVDPTVTSGANDTNHPPGSAWYASTVQDGSKPNKGGTGHVLINTAGYTPDQRNIYTYLTDTVPLQNSLSTTTSLTNASNAVDFNNGLKITRCRLGDVSACGGTITMPITTKETLISYIRGGNLGDAACTDGSTGTACTTWTTWPHTGVEHSKPAVVTYDSTDLVNGQFMFYLQTNGMLTAVNTHTGKEQWSFLVEEALPKLAAMRSNLNGPEIYAADGDPVVYYDDQNGDGIINGADRVWIYFGLRRGGKSYYALDITSKLAPIFKWKISNETGTGKICNGTSTCAAAPEFNELGETWSTPAIGKIKYLFGAPNNPPAVIFGGGYDPGEDSVPPSSRTMGRAVYVVNGNDGAVIKSWGAGAQTGTYLTAGTITTYAIPSQLTAINADFDGQNYLDRLMVGDLGGNVWRFDIDDAVPANWRGLHLASLSNNPAAEPKRKFFFPPAIALQNATGFDFHAVYIGSGDKEHPLLTTATTPATTDDKIFMLMDDPSLNSGGGTPSTAGPSVLPTPITVAPSSLFALTNVQTTGVAASSLVGMQGWYRGLDLGEKVINAATVFKFQLTVSRLVFGTYAPTAQLNLCTPPGEGRLNEIDSLTGDLIQINGTSLPPSRYYTDFKGRGFVSSSQSLILDTASGRQSMQVVCIGPSCKFQPTGTLGAPTKIYWYMEPEQ